MDFTTTTQGEIIKKMYELNANLIYECECIEDDELINGKFYEKGFLDKIVDEDNCTCGFYNLFTHSLTM